MKENFPGPINATEELIAGLAPVEVENKSPIKNSEAAEIARAKSEGFHFTEEGEAEDRYQFERQQRFDTRKAGLDVDESLYSHKSVQNRKDSDAQFELQAEAKNNHRGILSKLLGKDKVNSSDMLREEADRVNSLVDKKLDSLENTATAQEIADEVTKSSEFKVNRILADKEGVTVERTLHKNGNVTEREKNVVFSSPGNKRNSEENWHRASFKEYLNNINPAIQAEMNEGQFNSAITAVEDLIEKTAVSDTQERKELYAGLQQMIADKIDSLVVSGDINGLRRVFLDNNLSKVSMSRLAAAMGKMPKELFQDQEVRTVVSGLLDSKEDSIILTEDQKEEIRATLK